MKWLCIKINRKGISYIEWKEYKTWKGLYKWAEYYRKMGAIVEIRNSKETFIIHEQVGGLLFTRQETAKRFKYVKYLS